MASVSDDGQALGDFDCGRSLCGCDRPVTMSYDFYLSNKDATPVGDATLICLDSNEPLGTTNSQGLLRVKVRGRSSPGCGFQSECRTAYFQTEDGGRERPFWFAQVIRGREVDSVERQIHVVSANRPNLPDT